MKLDLEPVEKLDLEPVVKLDLEPVEKGNVLFTPISKQLTGKSIGERTDFLEKSAKKLTDEAVAQGRTPGISEFFMKQLPAATAQAGVELADLSPFDLGLAAATYGVGRVPVSGTTLGRIASKVPVGKGFVKGVKELGRLDKTLSPFKGQIANVALREATAAPAVFTKTGERVVNPREQLVPSIQRQIPKEAKGIVDKLGKMQAEILAADRGIIPAKKQVAMAKTVDAGEVLNSWKPGAVANAETLFSVRINLADRVMKLSEKPSREVIEKLSKDFIKADAMASETGRALGSLNKVQSMAADQLKFMTDNFKTLDVEAQGAAKRMFKQFQAPGFWDKFMEFRTAGLLSSPYTHERNIIGNAIGRFYRLPEKIVAGGADVIQSKLSGSPRSRFAKEGLADFVGMTNGFRGAMKNAVSAFADENFVSDARVGSRLTEAVKFQQSIPGKFGKTIRLPFRALNAMDEFVSTLSRSASLYTHATRQAMKEGAKDVAGRVAELVKNPTMEMIATASKEALVDTYRQPLGGLSKNIQGALNKSYLGKFIVPFFRTPVNLFKWSFDRGPTSLVSPGNWKAIAKGPADLRAEAMARIALGQLFSAGLFTQAAQGNITGRLSGNQQKREAMMRQGIMPYSIKVGNKYISYRSYEPISSMLALVANTSEILKEKNTKIDVSKTAEIVMETVKMLKDQSFLKGISDLFNAMDDPERYAEKFIQNSASSLIPSISSYLSRLYDPIIRDPDSVPEALLSKVPYFSKKVPPKLDVWGRSIDREGSLTQRAILPSGVSTAKPDLTEEELLSLEKFPRKITKTYRGLPITTQDRNNVTIAEGNIAKKLLDVAVNRPEYKGMNPEDQKALLDKIINGVRKEVRKTMIAPLFIKKLKELKTNEEKILLIEKFTRKKLIK